MNTKLFRLHLNWFNDNLFYYEAEIHNFEHVWDKNRDNHFCIMFQDYIPSINMECQYSNNSIYVEDMADLRRGHVTFWSNGSWYYLNVRQADTPFIKLMIDRQSDVVIVGSNNKW